jgi:hypothetical protein
MSQDFEFNKDGFKLSYQRYLSDGVTGLLFISFFIVAFINKRALPVARSCPLKFGREDKVRHYVCVLE